MWFTLWVCRSGCWREEENRVCLWRSGVMSGEDEGDIAMRGSGFGGHCVCWWTKGGERKYEEDYLNSLFPLSALSLGWPLPLVLLHLLSGSCGKRREQRSCLGGRRPLCDVGILYWEEGDWEQGDIAIGGWRGRKLLPAREIHLSC